MGMQLPCMLKVYIYTENVLLGNPRWNYFLHDVWLPVRCNFSGFSAFLLKLVESGLEKYDLPKYHILEHASRCKLVVFNEKMLLFPHSIKHTLLNIGLSCAEN